MRHGKDRRAGPAGPLWPAVLQMVAFGLRPRWFLDHCARRYGDRFTVRFPALPGFGGPMVFVSDPDAVREIFAGEPGRFLGGERLGFLAPLMGRHSVLLLDGPEHHRQRRLLLPAFHGDLIASLRHQVADIAHGEIDSWTLGATVTLRPRMQSITLSVIIRLVLGVEPARATPFRAAMDRLITQTFALGVPALVLLSRRPQWRTRRFLPWSRYVRAADRVDALLYGEIARQRADPDTGSAHHVLAALLRARDEDGVAMDDAEIRDELITLLLAGYETSATGLAWTLDLLAHDRPAWARAQQASMDGDREYLGAVVTEALRVRPPLPFAGRVLTEDTDLGGRCIPAGWSVVACSYLAHRRPESYPEPEVFRPERFVGRAPERNAWLPFGGGYRRCVGAALATLEMEEVLAAVLSRVELRPAMARPERVRLRNIVFTPARGARVVITVVRARVDRVDRTEILARPDR
jgi:cytochrome P450